MKLPEELTTFPYLREMLNRLDICTLATYPPVECGIATFTKDLVDAIHKFTPFSEPCIIAVNEEGEFHRYDRRVRFVMRQNDPESYLQAADWVNESDVDAVSIQHEHGIYRGPGGNYLTSFLKRVKKPKVTTLHTVLAKPYDNEKLAVQEVFEHSDRVVAMVDAAHDILRDSYEVDVSKLRIVPHGVPNIRREPLEKAKEALGLSGRQVVATFGLISRSKGIEHAIKAMAAVAKELPDALYLVLGQTHPVVRRREGEEYRNYLTSLVRENGLEKNVVFENRYLTLDEIIAYLNATDVYVTPYLGPDQIVSGTLSYALGCGKAIVSTSYLYAKSVLGGGRGLLADFESADSLAEGILRLLMDPVYRKSVEEAAFKYGRRTTWHNVAIDYLDIFHHLVGPEEERAADWIARRNVSVA
ncbi:MAG TPA: glycosyltransferase family 4 protein [Armatimonadota bacterium]